MPAIIHAKRSDVADSAVICGDPARVKSLAGLLDGARVINTNRGFLAYTGRFRGRPMTVAAHGIGQPSVAIVIEELAQLGAKSIIRLGTAGALSSGIMTGEFAVISGASYADGSTVTQYEGRALNGISIAQTPDFGLTIKLAEALKSRRMKFRFTNTFSSDSFYSFSKEFARSLAAYGNDVVNMEVSTLFMLGKIKKLRTASLLVVSNNVIKDTEMLSHERLEKVMLLAGEVAFTALIK